jgi:hypothetical protein
VIDSRISFGIYIENKTQTSESFILHDLFFCDPSNINHNLKDRTKVNGDGGVEPGNAGGFLPS